MGGWVGGWEKGTFKVVEEGFLPEEEALETPKIRRGLAGDSEGGLLPPPSSSSSSSRSRRPYSSIASSSSSSSSSFQDLNEDPLVEFLHCEQLHYSLDVLHRLVHSLLGWVGGWVGG